MTPQLPAQPNQSLIRGLEVLQAVIAAGKSVGSRELARSLQMEPTVVNRHLKTLTHMGLLNRTPDRKYNSGSGVHVLAALSLQGSSLLRVTLPHAKTLWEEGYALTLGVLWREYLCFLMHARPEWPFEKAVAGHEVVPAPKSSAGMILLAHQPKEVRKQWHFEQPPRVVEPIQDLEKQLKQTLKQGYGIRHYEDGTISIGLAIGDPPVAAFAISRENLKTEDIPELVKRLQITTQQIATDAGNANGQHFESGQREFIR